MVPPTRSLDEMGLWLMFNMYSLHSSLAGLVVHAGLEAAGHDMEMGRIRLALNRISYDGVYMSGMHTGHAKSENTAD
jgi:hypothetical protein